MFFSPSKNRFVCINVEIWRSENLLSTPLRQCICSGTKSWSDAEIDNLTKFCGSTTVITAKREVQTLEGSTVYVKELDVFFTMKVLENSPAVLSLGKLCDEKGYSYSWINGQKPHLIKDGIRIICTRRTSFLLWFQACQVLPLDLHQLQGHLWNRRVILHHLLHPHLPPCRCGRQLDVFGHHRAACPEAGVLGKRGFPLERAAAQVCREAGARVSTMDLATFNALNGRRLEIVADGLTRPWSLSSQY